MGQPDTDEARIRALAALLHEMDLTEIEVSTGDAKLRVVRQVTLAPAAPAPVAAPPPSTASAPGTPAAPQQQQKGGAGAVLSPMVGTAYRSPEPGAPPFVETGDAVRAGQVVMIVEAMKTMNQIVAERAGEVTEIFVEDGQPVEYGEPLLTIT